MNPSSVNNSFSFNHDPSRMPFRMQQQFLQRVRNHIEINDLLNQQKNQSGEQKSSSNEELFADIERARNNQNSSDDSKGSKERRSRTVGLPRNSMLEKAIDQFNDSRLLIMTHCDQEIYNDENVEVNEEQECDKSTMMDEINEVFSDKHRCLTPPEGSSTVPPTSSSLQATPENKKGTKGYTKSILSTEISNEPESQRLHLKQTLSSQGSEQQFQYQQQYAYQQQPYNYPPNYYQYEYDEYQYYQENQRRKRKTISDEDSHMFVVNPETICSDPRTTIMIKNIPNKYTIQLLLDLINKSHEKTYDFFYLPIDFKNRCNMGYAFMNFIDTKYIKMFYEQLHGKKWPHFNSEKICVLRYARIQGRQALIQHFQFSSVMNQKDKKLKPVILPHSELSKFQMLIQRQQQNQRSQQFFQQ